MSAEPPLNLVITTTSETPVISPLSSVKSSTTSPESSFRSVSPGDSSNPPSVVNSPQSISSSIGSRSGGHVNEGTVSSSHSTLSSAQNSDDDSPENIVTRKLQGLTLTTKIDSSVPKVKPVTLLPPSGGAHTRTSPLYTPSPPAPGYYFVQKDGQVYNVEIPVDSTGSSQLSPGTYYPGTWSPSGLPHIQAFSQQPTPRGYETSPSGSVTGVYTDYQTPLTPHQQHQQQAQAFLIHASHLPQIRSRPESRTHSQTNSPSSQQPQHHIALVQPQPSTPSKLSPKHKKTNEKHSPEREQDGKEEDDVLSSLQSVGIGMNSSRKDKGHESEKIDNKHTKFQEVHREMFYSAEQARTVLTTATPVGVLLPTGEVQVSSLVAPVPSPPQQKVDRAFQFPYQLSGSTMNKQEISTPSYSVGYPYQVYYDPTTQQVTYGYGPPPTRSYASPSQPGTPTGQPSPHGTPVAIYSPTGEITGPNSASSRAVYQFPLAGEWGAGPPGFYTPPPQKTRGKGVRQGPCLFVFHIPPSVTDEELHQLFSSCGRVTSAKVMRNPHTNESKGFGFVNMANQREVEQAISTLHGYYWKNKYLKVSYKKKRYHSRNS